MCRKCKIWEDKKENVGPAGVFTHTRMNAQPKMSRVANVEEKDISPGSVIVGAKILSEQEAEERTTTNHKGTKPSK